VLDSETGENPQRHAKVSLLRRARRLVVKIGSSVLADERGICAPQMERLAAEVVPQVA